MNNKKLDLAKKFSSLPANKKASFLQLLRERGYRFSRLPIVSTVRGNAHPISFAQARQLFLWELDRESTAYHIAAGLRLEGELDVEAVKGSFSTIVARHESLRTVFKADADGVSEQVILEQPGFAVEVIDLSELQVNQEVRLQEEARRLRATPFDLAEGPLLRVGLIRLGEREHVLVVVMHHIVSDGWSMQVLVDEFVELYKAGVERRAPVLRELPIQYADYAVWQRQWMEAGERDRQLAYWKAHLGEEQPVLQLPTDRPRRPDGRYRAASHGLDLPAELVQGLQALGRAHGATLFMVLLAGWQVLLSRYTGQEDIRVGVPNANRNRPETEGVIGFFVNTQVLRGVVSPEMSLEQVLEQAKAAALGAQEHQELPFEQLVDALQPQRLLGVNPLFQVRFTHERTYHRVLANLLDMKLEPYRLGEASTQFDLMLSSDETADGRVSVNLTYAAELLAEKSIQQMLGHFVSVLRLMFEQPQRLVGTIELLSSDQHDELLRYSLGPAFEPPSSVLERVNRYAKSKAVALVCGEAQLSHVELDRHSDLVAHQLLKRGVGPEVRVALRAERSVEFVVGLLAVLKAGGAYVPLDPALPAERLAYMVRDSAAALVLSTTELAWDAGVPVLPLELTQEKGTPAALPSVQLDPRQAAYVIYTSGSTGQPKGVVVSHGALANYVQAMLDRLELGDDVRSMAMVSTVAADLGNTVLYGALCSGRTLHLLDAQLAFDPDAFGVYMSEHQVDMLKIVPSHLQALLSAARPEQVLPRRRLVLGGEATQWQLLDRIQQLRPELKVLNHYGPTETTVGVLTQEAEEADRERAGTLPVGRPLGNGEAYVLDGELNLVPQGVAGELYLGGAQVARGYQARAAQTAERFIANVFGEGARLYRTGDRVRMLADGSLEFLGRMDDQVKVRGYRVELKEIEARLLAEPEVREAAVVAAESPAGARLVGYVSSRIGQKVDIAELKDRLGRVLPEYMVPSTIVTLAALPLNANGKVDRKALPDPEFGGGESYEAPQGEVEETLAAVWAEVLGVEKVGRNDSFFELGGDSILSLKVVARARRRGLELSPRQIFEHQRLALVAKALIEASDAGTEAIVIPALSMEQRAGGLAPSYAQARQLFLWELDRESTAYHIAAGLRLEGELDVDAVKGSFSTIVARHESLRTVFKADADGVSEQVILEQPGFAVEVIDLSELQVNQEVRLQEEARRLRATPFDLAEGPLLRVGLIRLGEREHVLVVVMHHIVSDGWSMQVLVDEFVELYKAGVEGRQANLKPLPIQYADYAVWQRQWMEAGERDRQLAYWKAHLGEEQPVLQLPTDRPRRADGRYRSAWHGVELPEQLVQGLQQLGRAHGATLFMVLLAGWQVLLSRYTGQEDIRVGVPNANRNRPETEGVIGFFVNTQVLRGVVSPEMSLEQVLEQAKAAALGAQEHQELPFEQLVDALQPQRLLGVNPLFQVMYSHQRRNYQALASLPGLRLQRYGLGEQAAQFELVLNSSETADGRVNVDLTYAVELFDASTIERMLGHFTTVLQALAERPQQAAAEVELLSDEEQQQLARWGVNARNYKAVQQPVHELVERWARERPDAVALVFGDEQLSYLELNARANRLAHRLISLGVGPEVRVGIAVERSIEMIVGLLGILKAGGAYVPLDPEYPAERLGFMVGDSGIELLLTQSHVRGRVPGGDTLRVLELNTADLSEEPGHDPQVPVHGQNLAYVIYTSGSTGRPKGAQLSHRNVSRLLKATEEWFKFGADDVWTLFHSYAFDFSVWEIFGALCTGGKLVVVPFWVSRAPEDFFQLLSEQQVTILNQTPSAFGQLIALPQAYTHQLALRVVIFGGEALEPARLKAWVDRWGDERPQLVNMYGITETTVHVTYRVIRQQDAENAGRSPVGTNIPDLGMKVLDSNLKLTPMGVAGELYVSGGGLARGYLHRAGLTFERFVADPFDGAGGRLYRTGDLVRWNADGQLEYLGRIDHQVKVRGFRIELGEVEAQLLAQPEVREAVVVAAEGPAGARLVGYVSAKAGQEADPAELKARLGQALPDYMVPSAIVLLEALPLNANGKVDRKALPDPEFGSGESYEAPQGEVEETLAAVWAEVLGVEQVGRQDSFFELGGDSILSLKVVARARRRGLELSPRQIFEHQQLASIARALSDASGAETVHIPVLGEEQRSGGMLLSYAQARQLFLWELDRESTAYHIAAGLRLEGELDVDAVKGSFSTIVARHESLRTVFRADADGVSEQVILEQPGFAVELMDLAGLDEAERQGQLEAQAQRLRATPFDLAEGPLLRVGLIRLGEREHVLVVVMHHIVSDGWSMQVLVDEFVELYKAGVERRAPVLRELPIQYADYAVWQRQWMEAGERDRQLAYWKAHLGEEQPVLQLPTDRPRRADGRYRSAWHGVELPEQLVQGLQQLGRVHGATLFMVLLAGWQVLLSRYTGQEDIRVGVPNANRNRPETEGVIGFFVNTQVLRGVVSPEMSLEQVLEQAKAAALGAQEHQELPFEQLVDALQPQRLLGVNPLFQVRFTHQRLDYRALASLPDLKLESYELGEQSAQFDLMLNTREMADGRVSAGLIYAQELFDKETIERMLEHFTSVLILMAEWSPQPVRDVEFLRPERCQGLLTESRGPVLEPAKLVLGQIKRHAKGKGMALVCGEARLSHAELDQHSDLVAHQLLKRGVGPEVRVALRAERSVEFVVGLLAVLKAGGAYVPLDPALPAERLAYMVRDSAAALVLSTAELAWDAGVPVQQLKLCEDVGSAAKLPAIQVSPEQAAYVIYTSGSTGQPKGVVVSHGALANYVQAMLDRLELGDDVRSMAMVSTVAADLGNTVLYGALCSGRTLHLLDAQLAFDPDAFGVYMSEHQVDMLKIVPSHLQALLSAARPEQVLPRRRLVLGGEATQWQLLDRIQQLRPELKVLNHYGPTETTVGVLTQEAEEADRERAGTLPVGRPLGNGEAYVLDGELNLVPQGVAGELYLGGAQVARGYQARAAQTAERFIANVFGEGARLYRTGDRVRMLADGSLEFLGRMDDQVKVRGYRVELKEIEARLLAEPEVREAAVVVKDGPEGEGARLVGYVSANVDQAAIDANVLRDRLGKALPDYMVPAAIVVLEALPLNANGKVDRKALPDPEFTGADAYEAPVGEVEETLAAVWAEVLGVEKVGRNDSFFELGGDSILSLKVVARARRRGLELSPRQIFEHQSLTLIARTLARDRHTEAAVPPNLIPEGCERIEPQMLTLVALNDEEIRRIEEAVPGGAANIQDIYPLAPLQEGILFHHLLQEKGDAYIVSRTLGFDSRERLERFIESLNEVIARHDILRTAVLWEGLAEPVQVVYRGAPLVVQWLDLPGNAAPPIQERLAALADASHYRIDVQKAPLIHAIAARDEAKDRWLLQLPAHHLVSDHTTMEQVIREIELIQQERAVELAEPVAFRGFVAQARLGVSQAEHEAYFRQQLGDVEEPTAPFGLLDVHGDGAHVREARQRLTSELSEDIRRQARRHRVSAASVFHLAWALLLARTTGRDDVVFGTVLFGRMQGGEGAERALGMFINTLPVRIRLGARTVKECLKQTHEALTGLLRHEHASLALAQRCSGLPGGTPLFSSLLNYRYGRPEVADGRMSNNEWHGIENLGGEGGTNYPFDVSIDDFGDGFDLVAQIDEKESAERVCRLMQRALERVVDALQGDMLRLTCELQVLDDVERQQLIRWGVNEKRYPHAKPVHELVERQVRERPDVVALVFGDEQLSYGELNVRANRLAHRLIGLGVGPEVRVGIAVERSIEMIVGLLGILKAGGAYVPLDPEYPAERLGFMVGDSGIELLLTQSHVRGRVPGGDTLRVLELNTADLSEEPGHDPQVPVHGQNLAYVIYTSGSTGRPKGVEVAHVPLSMHCQAIGARYGLRLTDRELQFASIGFDAASEQWMMPLLSGAAVVLRAPEVWSGDRLVAEVRSRGVTVLDLPPSYIDVLTQGTEVPDLDIHTCIIGGEGWQKAGFEAVRDRLRPKRMFNAYGPTEAVITPMVWEASSESSFEGAYAPLGHTVGDRSAYVLDGEMNLAPRGVAGELYLGGVGLARGYLRRGGLSAERFVADPFDEMGEGGRLYRTGDLVRWNADGQLEYLGRIDHQVKVRGFRIELGEVEAQLLAQPEVREAVVVAAEGPAGARLVGYVSAKAGQEADPAELKARLGQALPDYMVPSAIVLLEALPLNANGKVDRKALPDPEFGSGESYEAPQGEVEETLAAVWAEVLGVERVGRHDDLFELGGHSLTAVKIVSRIQQLMQRTITVRSVFQNRTLKEQAELISAMRGEAEVSDMLSSIDTFIESMVEAK
ncbi:MAG: amino acid adenylation domain-containing protein [Acidovorax sp.]